MKRGWVPWDAGAYAQSADRVLHGELPHRDFVEIYTGGLTYLNAAAMRIFGESLAAERLMLFVFFLAWIPVLYWIASQFCADWIAGGLVLLSVTWSVPNYSDAIPSWFNLFFATFGLAAMLAYLKRPAWKWLLLAGVCGGLSFLAKSVGLCYIAGVLLFFLFREQSMNRQAVAMEESFSGIARDKSQVSVYSILLCAFLTIFLALLIRLILPVAFAGLEGAAGEFVLFVLPSAMLCSVLVTNEFRIRGPSDNRRRFANLFRLCVPFGIGAVLPVLVFLSPYFRAHATGALFRNLFAQVSKRIAAVHKLPDGIVTIIPAISLVVFVAASARLGSFARRTLFACVTGLLASGLLLSLINDDSYIAVWSAAYWLPPIVVAVGGGILLCRVPLGESADAARTLEKNEQLFLLLSVTALCSLVEFPYSAPVYFCYIAPLAVLVIAALLRLFSRASRAMLAVLYAGFLLFATFIGAPGFIFALGFRYHPDVQTAVMSIPRTGGLRIDPGSAAIYDTLIPLIRARAGSGEIYAAPDSPEVYFLSGYHNLTPDIYDFLNPQASHSGMALRLIANPQIRVVVLNDKPPLSPPLPDDLHQAIIKLFPSSQMVGNFEVRWRP